MKINNINSKIDTIELVKIKNEELIALGFNYDNLEEIQDFESLEKGEKIEIFI